MLLPPVREAIDTGRDLAGTALFVAGTVVGGLGAALGLYVVAGLTGALPSPVRATVLAVTIGLLAVAEAGWIALRLGGRQEPIPQERFRRSMLRGQFVFGAELGVGFRTRITHVGPYVLVAVLLLVHVGPAAFALVALGWGVGRGSAFGVRLLQRPVLGDLGAGQHDGADNTARFHAIMGTVGVWATQLLLGGAAVVAAQQLAVVV